MKAARTRPIRKSAGSKPQPKSVEYQPTEKERSALSKHAERYAAAATAPRVKVIDSETLTKLDLDHPDTAVAYGLLMEALSHHQQLHNAGNEISWWHDVSIKPLAIAKDLWSESKTKVRPQ